MQLLLRIVLAALPIGVKTLNNVEKHWDTTSHTSGMQKIANRATNPQPWLPHDRLVETVNVFFVAANIIWDKRRMRGMRTWDNGKEQQDNIDCACSELRFNHMTARRLSGAVFDRMFGKHILFQLEN